MYKTLKISIIVIMALFFISGVIALSLQTLISFIAYPIGALFLYYSALLLLITFLKAHSGSTVLSIIIWVLVLAPIAWVLLAPENLFNSLTPKLNLDMR